MKLLVIDINEMMCAMFLYMHTAFVNISKESPSFDALLN